MTAKQYLNRAYSLRKRIAAKELRKEELMAQAQKITADITGMPRGSGNQSPVERAAAAIADLSWEIEKDWLDLIGYQEEIRQAIESVKDPNIYQVLTYRYLAYKRWEDIADLMHYTPRNVFILHKKGLKLVEAFIVFH